jgi:hypothetical protein
VGAVAGYCWYPLSCVIDIGIHAHTYTEMMDWQNLYLAWVNFVLSDSLRDMSFDLGRTMGILI